MSNYSEIALNLGETWTIEATLNHQDLTGLEGCQISWRLASQTAKILEVSLGKGVTVIDSATRKCRIVVPTSLQINKNVKFGTYTHELVLTLPDGSTSIQANGKVTVSQTISSKYPW